MSDDWTGSNRRSEPREKFAAGVLLSCNGQCAGHGTTKDRGSKSLYVTLRCSDPRLSKGDRVEVEVFPLPITTPRFRKGPVEAEIVRTQTHKNARGLAIICNEKLIGA